MSDTSAAKNVDALANQAPTGGSNEFHASKGGDAPLTTGGHQPGKLVGNDAAPEFHAQTLPPGSAPADRTFKPNNISEVPPVTQTTNDIDPEAPQPPPNDMPGATSGSVNTGLGKPIQGQTSSELHHDGQHHRKNPGTSLDGRKSGATGKTVDPHDPQFANQRALDKDEAVIGRGNVGGPAAEEREPVSAEQVASSRK
ncbi:hypothetical protein Tdes44962_MAKER01932 [Teratosphaeria destructans]|uniref:Uncharacterized protein n=1 Tax=Teratosphaeria destructans TaxID=418781 RepID=A0A9W7SWJ0_9PEZI|nr:hypothetical protein Tdes44962_MAKER01932 [Teratosphaeria destructans]